MSLTNRLHWQVSAAKASQRSPQAILPPPVGAPRRVDLTDAEIVARAFADGHPLAKLMRLRAEAAAEVERLLTFLDESEGLADAEEGDLPEDGADDEASLGAASLFDSGDQTFWAAGNDEDLELEHDGREPDDECDGRPDEEPSLGWCEGMAPGAGALGRYGGSGVGSRLDQATSERPMISELGSPLTT